MKKYLGNTKNGIEVYTILNNEHMIAHSDVNEEVIAELAPLIDAANIDLKGPSQAYYDWVGGDFKAVSCSLKGDAGVHDLYFVFKGAMKKDLFEWDWWRMK